jgi:hypothetical protein
MRLFKDGGDYGFVHQVLTFSREHDASLSSTFTDRMGTRPLEFLVALMRHGSSFLSPEDYTALVRAHRRAYCHWLVRVMLKPWDRGVWRYQAQRRAQFDLELRLSDILSAILSESLAVARSPREAYGALKREYARATRSKILA